MPRSVQSFVLAKSFLLISSCFGCFNQFRPAQLAEIKRHSSLEAAHTTILEPIHARLTPYHGSLRRDFVVVCNCEELISFNIYL